MASIAQGRFSALQVEPRAWATLVAAGLADGAAPPVSADRFSDTEIVQALRGLPPAAELDGTSRELLLAWLCALRDHFPARFESVLGTGGGELIAKLQGTAIDRNRFLKFRRISLARLSRMV